MPTDGRFACDKEEPEKEQFCFAFLFSQMSLVLAALFFKSTRPYKVVWGRAAYIHTPLCPGTKPLDDNTSLFLMGIGVVSESGAGQCKRVQMECKCGHTVGAPCKETHGEVM